MPLQVRQLSDKDTERWDEFVTRSPDATFFHLAAWKTVLERAFRHRCYFLYAELDGRVVGILPLAEVRSALFGHTLSSTPFCVYGGVVADNPEIEKLLVEKACELGTQLGVGSLELRNLTPTKLDWPTNDLYVTFRKEISTDHNENLKAIPNRQRAMVRKAINEGLQSEFDEGFDRIYTVYAHSLRNLGTPVFARNYFRILREVFGDACDVLMIRYNDIDIAGVLNFYFRDQVLPYYGGSVSQARNVRGVNHFMYWELMRHSADRGFRIFDFGRSKINTGAFDFKKNFGFTPEPLQYQYHLVTDEKMPEKNPNNPKFRIFIKAWKHLPLPIANTIGPFLARSLG